MIRIASLDDDLECIEVERHITDRFWRDREEIRFYTFTNVEKFLFELEERYCDIYLLDMELPCTNGLEIAKKIKQKYIYASIIYVTNYIDYAIEAFEVNAFRYIPKDELKEKLPEAYEALFTDLKQKESSYFMYHTSSALRRIPMDDIYYMEKLGKYVEVKYRQGENRFRMTLDEAYEKLNPKDFIKINKSDIVNLMHVMALEGHRLQLRNGVFLDVSQPQLKNVKIKIAEYWRD